MVWSMVYGSVVGWNVHVRFQSCLKGFMSPTIWLGRLFHALTIHIKKECLTNNESKSIRDHHFIIIISHTVSEFF